MSNIGNKIRAGFYATPESQGEYIRSLLNFKSETVVFDPTCGEGSILKQLTEQRPEDRHVSIKTYGVELDKRRAAQAKEQLDVVVQAAIESMVISHDTFGLVYLNPPYDHTMLGTGDEGTSRKESIELVRNTKYLADGGVMIYVIPSYRFADSKIARYLSTHFEDIAMTKFSVEDYDDFKQCIFIGKKKSTAYKGFNQKLFDFLLQMDNEDFVSEHVTDISVLVNTGKTWNIPSGKLNVPTFYSRVENKKDFVDLIRQNKGFQAFVERTKPKQLELGGDPLINIAQGQMALLLASGAVNGLVGKDDDLHAVQGMELVTTVVTEEETEHAKITKKRTNRKVSVKVILPSGVIKKYV